MPVNQVQRGKIGVQEEEQKQKFEMKLPVRKVTQLPSNFRAYSTQAEISYVPYTFGELLNFGQSSMSRADNIEFTLKGIYTTGMDKKDIIFYDYVYIALLRKLSSFKEDEFVLEYDCYSCGAKNKLPGKLSELSFKELNVPAIPVKIKDDEGNELHFSPLTVGNFLTLLRENKTGDKLGLYASTVTNMDKLKAKAILSKASGDFLRSILYVDEILTFGLESITRNCTECKASNILGMDEPEVFVLPFRGSEGLIGDRISFGL